MHDLECAKVLRLAVVIGLFGCTPTTPNADGGSGAENGTAGEGASFTGSNSAGEGAQGGAAPGGAGAAAGGGQLGSGASATAGGADTVGGALNATDCTGLPLCDGFESASAGGPPSTTHWTIATPNCSGTGAVIVDSAVSHTGEHSLRIDGAAGYCNHVFVANSTAMANLGSTLWARMFLRLQSGLGAEHVTFLALHDSSDNKDLRMGGQSNIFMWNRELNDATLPALSPAGIALSLAPTANTWHCLEFNVTSSGALQTFVDGATITGLTIDGVATADIDQQWLNSGAWTPTLTDLRIGWESYGSGAMTLWVDDVALGTSRIGCI
jgi:hypothetical protein